MSTNRTDREQNASHEFEETRFDTVDSRGQLVGGSVGSSQSSFLRNAHSRTARGPHGLGCNRLTRSEMAFAGVEFSAETKYACKLITWPCSRAFH